MKKVLCILMTLAIFLGVFMFIAPNTVKAASSGSWGTATYELDDDNNLVFTGSGTITTVWPLYVSRADVVTISTAEGVTISLPENSSGLFQNCAKLKSIDLSHFNTTGVTDMSYMFNKCSKLVTLDVSNFDTSSVTNMQYMFSMTSTGALKSIVGLENWDVSHVQYMQSMFYAGFAASTGTYNPYYYGTLTSLNLSGWNLASVRDMRSMFFGQKVLTSLDLSGWHTGQLTSFGVESMFQGCQALTSIDISGIDGSHCGYVRRMFRDCKSLTNIIGISSWDTSGDYIFDEMFYNCAALEQLDLSSFEVSRNVSGQLTAKSMFFGCSKLTTLDLSNFNSNRLANMTNMFGGCPSLCSVKLGSEWSFRGSGSVTGSDLPSDGMWSRNDFAYGPYVASALSDEYDGSTMAGTWIKLSHYAVYSPSDTTLYFVMSYDANVNEATGSVQSVNGGTYSGTIYRVNPTLNYSAAARPWQSVKTKATRVVFVDAYKPTNMANWFNGFNQCTSFVWGPLDTSQVQTFNNTFWSVSKLTSLDLTGWNTSSATDMSFMFGGCVKLTSLNVSSLDTSHVTSMTQMFSQLESIEYLDVSNFDTSSVTGMHAMFGVGCRKLKTIEGLENWDVSGVMTMTSVFGQCESLTSKGFEQWDVSSVTNLQSIFQGCKSLTQLNLSGWNPTGLTDCSQMFSGCTSLEKVDISNLNTSNVRQIFSMFGNCPKLSEVNLGENFDFAPTTLNSPNSYAVLPTPPSDSTTGLWKRADEMYGPYTPVELKDNYSPTMAGWWIWDAVPLEYTIKFVGDEETTGSMMDVTANYNEDFTLPKNKLIKYGYDFESWTDGTRRIYQDEDTIPADTYAAGDVITLTAMFTERDTSITMEDGAFTFTLRDGERATFKDIPAGTSYQVYELTEDGWVLVQQENTAGIIEALEVSVAQFYNKYMPGITTVQFSGTKTLDGKAVQDAERFWFELWEGETLIESVGNSDGGFIQFSPIEYSDDDVGEHTYTIKEVFDEYDSEIEYDKHEETVTVTVELVDGKITNTVEYDTDGIKFENMTRPGSLKLSKYNNGISTDANEDDEFTFEITFRNESGMLVDDNIYWYIEGEAQVPTQEEPIESPQPED